MKGLKIQPSIHIHPLFFLLAVSALLTGAIYEFIILFSIVAIHELGHYFTARHYKWRVSHIEFWLLGGAVVSEEHTTKPMREQVHVTLAGPFQNVWIFVFLQLIVTLAGPHPLISTAIYYNGLILLLNLLPIWPLDGGKLLFYTLTPVMSFKSSLKLALLISIFSLTSCFLWMIFTEQMTLAGTMLTGFLILENVLEWRRQMYVFMRYVIHCLERDVSKMKVKYFSVPPHMSVMEVVRRIRTNRHHIYVLKGRQELRVVDDQECLNIFLREKQPHARLYEVVQ
ncbi:site-2 protease family protein [Halobacillus sp. Marseille-Q1614]|uniref:site-2 protease family protein n=1 Tax=Halobacillus sp. Marseille-Q1614 TaxID=2709134 RepID=UPI001570B60B|nr:site-2 protease family protein [Halobacillus sp. Marseille-Q1614]